MLIKHFILNFIFMGFATKCVVEGLQCYVCEDCNEYEDFKELHICGEISTVSTLLPFTIPQMLENNDNNIETTLKPTQHGDVDDYLYEDPVETNDETISQNSFEQKKPTTTAENTTKSTTTAAKPLTLEEKITTSLMVKPTTQSSTTSDKKETTLTRTYAATSKKTFTAATTIAAEAFATTIKPSPTEVTDYDDYLEYEEARGRYPRSLLKVNEPVCYMIKYHVNNTIITNRGCTTFINASKMLTCQSLYNGAPMDTCRVCTSDGCNKFLSYDSSEDDHGMVIIAGASAKEKFAVFGFLILALINRFIV